MLTVDIGRCETFKVSRNEDLEIAKVNAVSKKYISCLLSHAFSLQPNERFDEWAWVNLGFLDKVGPFSSGTTAI